eukprot:6401745-Prymnesium_polylepis.1
MLSMSLLPRADLPHALGVVPTSAGEVIARLVDVGQHSERMIRSMPGRVGAPQRRSHKPPTCV